MKNKLNIAFLLTKVSERGGISRVVSILSEELHLINLYNIHIVSFQPRDQDGYNWNENLSYHDLLKEDASMKKGILKASRKLRVILKQKNIDILISCGDLVGPLGVLSTVFNKTKLVYWSHSSFKSSSSNKYRVFNEQLTAPFSKYLVSLTKVDEKNYKSQTLARQVIQIYNPIDKKIENIQTDYDLSSKKIVSVGRLTKQKNFETLVDVAKIVLEKHSDFEWHIYGSGRDEYEIKKKIEKNSLTKNLILKGQCNNLYEKYNEYSMMVMTSLYEGFPMTLLEGMAFKLPLVSFDILTGPNEIIKHEDNGFLIKPFDIVDMANKICFLIENPIERELFSKRNGNHISEFNMKSIVTKWQFLLNS